MGTFAFETPPRVDGQRRPPYAPPAVRIAEDTVQQRLDRQWPMRVRGDARKLWSTEGFTDEIRLRTACVG